MDRHPAPETCFTANVDKQEETKTTEKTYRQSVLTCAVSCTSETRKKCVIRSVLWRENDKDIKKLLDRKSKVENTGSLKPKKRETT